MHCVWLQPICNVRTEYAFSQFVDTNTETTVLIYFNLYDENSVLAMFSMILFCNAKKKNIMIA